MLSYTIAWYTASLNERYFYWWTLCTDISVSIPAYMGLHFPFPSALYFLLVISGCSLLRCKVSLEMGLSLETIMYRENSFDSTTIWLHTMPCTCTITSTWSKILLSFPSTSKLHPISKSNFHCEECKKKTKKHHCNNAYATLV